MIKFLGSFVLISLITVSVLRGIGVMSGDFIVPLMLLVQLIILGYIYNILQLISRDIVIRYNSNMNSKGRAPDLHTWN